MNRKLRPNSASQSLRNISATFSLALLMSRSALFLFVCWLFVFISYSMFLGVKYWLFGLRPTFSPVLGCQSGASAELLLRTVQGNLAQD